MLATASILPGEVGVVRVAAEPVAEIVQNRWLVLGHLRGWNGHDPMCKPEPWAWDIAIAAVHAGGDPDGDIFALSQDDMEALGFAYENWTNVGTTRWPVWIGRVWG